MPDELHACKHPRLTVIEATELSRQMTALPGWSLEDDGLVKHFHFDDAPSAIAFLNQVAEVAERLNHHPYTRWFKRDVRLRLRTRKSDGVTGRDFELARACDELRP